MPARQPPKNGPRSESMVLTVHVTVNAHASRAIYWDGRRLFAHLKAPPRENAANLALIELLAELFALPKTTIRLKRGARSREKQIEIPLPEHAARKILDGFEGTEKTDIDRRRS